MHRARQRESRLERHHPCELRRGRLPPAAGPGRFAQRRGGRSRRAQRGAPARLAVGLARRTQRERRMTGTAGTAGTPAPTKIEKSTWLALVAMALGVFVIANDFTALSV